MDSDAEMMERHARLLGRFAEQAASLAEDLCTAALAAESVEQKQALTLAFHRTGRTLRQTLALEAKLRRDAKRQDHIADDRAGKTATVRAEARKAQVRRAVEALIWDEAEDDEQVGLVEQLIERLDAEALDAETFLAEPPDLQIARICQALGLPPGVIPRSGAKPDPEDPSGIDDDPLLSDDYWKSSA